MLNLDKVKARLSPKVFDSINTLVDRGDTATLKKWLDAAKEHYKFIGAKSANSDALYYEIEYIKYLLEIKETKMLNKKEKQLVREYAKKLVEKRPLSEAKGGVELPNSNVYVIGSANDFNGNRVPNGNYKVVIERNSNTSDDLILNFFEPDKGINVINTPAASSNSVAELVFAHLFSAVRFLYDSNRQMSNGEDKFEELIQKLAPLMKFREAVIPLAPAKFNLKDIVSEKEFIEFGPQHEALSVAKYRELVEKKINELVSSSPILQKLKQGQEITTDEAEQLAEELHNEHPHITIDLLRKVYNHRKAALVQFIKHILGIEQLETFAETVTKAFDHFIAKHSYLTSRQLQFLDLLKNFVLEKGDVSKRNLIESPFTMLHPEGIRGIFNTKEIDEIIELTNKVLAA